MRSFSEELAAVRYADRFATYLAIIPPCIGLIWAAYESYNVYSVKLDGKIRKTSLQDAFVTSDSLQRSHSSVAQQLEFMKHIAQHISDGASTFLIQESRFLSVYMIAFSLVLGPTVGIPCMVAFIVGALTSMFCGFIGMKIAVVANVRTAHEAWTSLGGAFNVALRGGSVMGFTLVSLGVLNLIGLIYFFRPYFANDTTGLFEAIAGYGLGGSSIALFSRVGGGIYTKAADVGADLSGKNEYGMAEDDPRNPACIADNVGDNVGDVAGMGADLFGSLAEATCAALVVAGSSVGPDGLATTWNGLMFPVVLSSVGILMGMATIIAVQQLCSVRRFSDIEKTLKRVILISTILQSVAAIGCSYVLLPGSFELVGFGVVTWWKAMIAVLLGLWAGLAIGFVTEYYTSHSYLPVREISRTQVVSAATGIIYGLALGYFSCVIPVLCLAFTICVVHQIAGMYGIALAALGMLGSLTMGLTIDAYGPISDNAGGIAEMSGLGPDVRRRTDALDAAGNTTAAVGKGFAIGSAALVSLALFGAYTVRAKIRAVDILDAWTFTGLFYGALLPYYFSAFTMKSVGVAATDMVQECLRQFPLIINGSMEPEYNKCIEISTRAAIREMIPPAALVILSPIIGGMAFGKNAVAGMLAGALVSGVQLAIAASNSGGAWDNSKKYIESGALGEQHAKGSAAHHNAVTGDTVGDPLKDTSGPSLNILIKLSAIISLVFGSVISSRFSNARGGPWWMHVAVSA